MPRHRQRLPWALRLVLALFVLLAVVWVGVWLVASPLVERRIEALLERRFAADVSFGSFSFLPPFWVVADDVVLASQPGGEGAEGPAGARAERVSERIDERVEWIRIPSLRVRLSWLPGGWPPEVALLSVSAPRLTVLRDDEELLHAAQLWVESAQRRARLPLRRIVARDATIEIRSAADAARESAPLVLDGFDLEMEADEGGARAYGWRLEGGERVRVDGTGVFDLDEDVVQVDALRASLVLGADGVTAQATSKEHDGAGGMPVAIDDAKGRIELEARRLRIDSAKLSFGNEPQIVLSDLQATATLADERIDVPDLAFRVFGGDVKAPLHVRLADVPRWQGDVELSALDLSALAAHVGTARDDRIAGTLSGRADLEGTLAPDALLSSLRGRGEVRARGERFYVIPLIGELLEAMRLGSEAVTVSSASAELHVADRTVFLDNVALGSPAIGMQGHGKVGFDGRVDVDVILVPLGDVREKVAGSGLPVIGDAVAAVAGTLQRLFAGVSELVYEFHVTGTLGDPQVTPVPVPALTRNASTVFERMVRRGWDADVLSIDERLGRDGGGGADPG